MSKYTRYEPFHYTHTDGYEMDVWRGADGCFESRMSDNHGPLAEAIHAMVEAERDEWRWTNDEHTEARKGRWLASAVSIEHDEVGSWGRLSSLCPAPAKDAHNSFLAWKSAQEQPAEPTGLGAVAEVNGERATFIGSNGHYRWVWANPDEPSRTTHWGAIAALGPVTVLSEGVTS